MRLVEFRGGLRVGGHPLHSLLIHFPIAFLLAVPALEAAGWLADWREGWRLAWLAQVAGLAASVPAALSGLVDLAMARKPAVSALGNLHMLAMTGSVSLMGLSLYLKGGTSAVPPGRLFATLGLSASAAALLIWGAWLGGEMVFRHGAGSRE
jgi:uncharacterized membrane protein